MKNEAYLNILSHYHFVGLFGVCFGVWVSRNMFLFILLNCFFFPSFVCNKFLVSFHHYFRTLNLRTTSSGNTIQMSERFLCHLDYTRNWTTYEEKLSWDHQHFISVARPTVNLLSSFKQLHIAYLKKNAICFFVVVCFSWLFKTNFVDFTFFG